MVVRSQHALALLELRISSIRMIPVPSAAAVLRSFESDTTVSSAPIINSHVKRTYNTISCHNKRTHTRENSHSWGAERGNRVRCRRNDDIVRSLQSGDGRRERCSVRSSSLKRREWFITRYYSTVQYIPQRLTSSFCPRRRSEQTWGSPPPGGALSAMNRLPSGAGHSVDTSSGPMCRSPLMNSWKADCLIGISQFSSVDYANRPIFSDQYTGCACRV